ncbi:MAG: hypothetical protein FWC28_09180 [Proteobacteria bacterium]|nr:hypothetical protein [Cystobacterineae bacterium]MCL2258237.1 hypothetical protein [Cystobacterineae bacterium]MCL2315398.1 hypothetical protein [Pseudomonadota bacterium]
MVGPFFMGLSVGVLWKLFFIARHGSNLSAKTVVGGVCSRKTRKVHCFRYDGTVMAEDWGKLFYSEQLLVAWGWKQEGECVFTVSRKAVGCFGDVHIVAQR